MLGKLYDIAEASVSKLNVCKPLYCLA